MKTNNFFMCILMAICGALTVCNTDIFTPIPANASGPPLPTVNFSPVGKFNLDVNLKEGTASVDSNLRISEANITVNHPTKTDTIFKPKYIVKYETKTEYLTKTQPPMRLLPGRLYISNISNSSKELPVINQIQLP